MSDASGRTNPAEENLYSAPGSAQARDSEPGSPVKAVLLGFVVDFGGTFVAGVALAVVYGAILAASGSGKDQIASSLANPVGITPYTAAAYAIGLTFSVLGGYCCARIAKRREYRLAAISASLSLVLAVATSSRERRISEEISTIALSYGMMLLGAHLGRRKNAALANPRT